MNVKHDTSILAYRRVVLGVCFALSGMSIQVDHVAAQASPPVMRQVSAHGLQLQLTIPRRTYPRDALVRVAIRLTNRSTRAIEVAGDDAPVCASRNGLGIEVRTKAGHIVFPPATSWALTSCGPVVFPTTVPPGESLVDHPLIVLRGSLVRAVVTLGPLGHPARELKTPVLRMRLRPRDVPPITFSTTGGTHLVIGPVPWRHAPLYYVESGVCLHPGVGGGGSGNATWQALGPHADGIYDFGMPCDGEVIWAFAGGMLNHSVVREFVHF